MKDYQKNRIRNLRRLAGDRSFHTACLILLAVAFVAVLYPLVYTVSSSFSATEAIVQGRVILWPIGFTLGAYKAVFNHHLIRSGFFNSLIYVAGGTTISVVLLLLAAYPLSRRDLPDKKLFTGFFVVIMFFNGGLIPNYLLVRNLHLLGSRWALILCFMFSCYNMIIVKSYFQNSIPEGLLDAAHMDGCGDIRFFFSIALPLAIPVIAVMVLFNSVNIWNSYFSGMLYLTRPDTFNFQMVLRDILFIAQMPQEMMDGLDPQLLANMQGLFQQVRYAVLVVGALPMMVLYPFIQRYFIKGMMIGSLKE